MAVALDRGSAHVQQLEFAAARPQMQLSTPAAGPESEVSTGSLSQRRSRNAAVESASC